MTRRYTTAYLAGAAAARTGGEMSGPALLLAALSVGGSVAEASSLLAAVTVAAAVGGPVLGVFLDRSSRPGRLLTVALALHASGLVLVLLALGRLPYTLVLLIAAATGLFGPALSGGWTAQLPRVAPPEGLARATALDAMTYGAAGLAGPALAGTVAGLLGARAAVLLSATLLGAALPVAWMLPGRWPVAGGAARGGAVVSRVARPGRGVARVAHGGAVGRDPRRESATGRVPRRESATGRVPRRESATGRNPRRESATGRNPRRESATGRVPRPGTTAGLAPRRRTTGHRGGPVVGPRGGPVVGPRRGSVASPRRGSVASPRRGSVASPRRGSVASPRRGSVASPRRGSVASPRRGSVASPRRGSVVGDLTAGVRCIRRSPSLAGATVTSVASCTAQGMLMTCAPVMGTRFLGGAGRGGLLLSGIAVVSLATNAALARSPGRRFTPDAVIRTGALLQAAALALAAGGRPALLAATVLLAGAGEGPQLTALFAVRQREAPERLRSQVFTTGASMKITGFALGAAVAGPVIDRSLSGALLLAAGVHVVGALPGKRGAPSM